MQSPCLSGSLAADPHPQHPRSNDDSYNSLQQKPVPLLSRITELPHQHRNLIAQSGFITPINLYIRYSLQLHYYYILLYLQLSAAC